MTDPALNVTATRDKANEIADPFSPLFPDVSSGGQRKYGLSPGCAEPGDLIAACRRARARFNPAAPVDEAVLEHALALARRLHTLGIIPLRESEAHIQELQWGRVRCLFAGLGHAYHSHIFNALHRLTPWCPVVPEEDPEAWEKAWRTAHETSGWPIGLLLMPWTELRAMAGFDEDPPVEDWHVVLTEAHILKHLRLDDLGDTRQLVILYRGEVHTCVPVADASMMANQTRLPWLAQRLGAGAVSDNHSPFDRAMLSKLARMSPEVLLRRQRLSELPPAVFISPAAHYVPDVGAMDGYFQHGLTLYGVKVAASGKVVDYSHWHGDPADILGYQWPSARPDVNKEVEAQWQAAMPTAYDATEWPSDVLTRYFPNLGFISHAHRAFLDALLCAQLCRAEVPRLGSEFPALCFLPAEATPEGSTKQGKSTLAKAVFHALAPAAIYAQRTGTDNISIRALNWEIADNGSAGFDEFRMSPNPASPMHRDRIQSLCCGEDVDLPAVRENRGKTYRLRAPLVIGAKTFDLPDDLQNRFLIFWMERLPKKAWENQELFFQAKNGALSCLMRLAALGQAQEYALGEWMQAQTISSSEEGFRYPLLRMLAAAILALQHPTMEDKALELVDAVGAAQALRLAQHTVQAEDSHLSQVLKEGAEGSKLSLDALVDGLDERGMCDLHNRIRVARGQAGLGENAGFRLMTLFNARADMISQLTVNEPLAKRLEALLPEHMRKLTDRRLSNALTDGLKIRFSSPAPDGSISFPGAHGLNGWRMKCKIEDDRSHSRRYWIYNDNPAHPTNRQPTPKNPIA